MAAQMYFFQEWVHHLFDDIQERQDTYAFRTRDEDSWRPTGASGSGSEHQRAIAIPRRPKRWYHLRSYDQRFMSFLEAEETNQESDDLAHDFVGTVVRGRYELLGKLGAGSFGTVFKVKDLWTKKFKALKICRNELYAKVEVKSEASVLSKLKKLGDVDRNNIVRLYSNFSCAGRECLITEYLPMSLSQYLNDYHPDGMPIEYVTRIAYNIIVGMMFLEENSIVHCDLKPQNIMMKDLRTLDIKIIDFGSVESCESVGRILYFQTRHYRAPEVLLQFLPLTAAVDMWSIGCILAECYMGYVLFEGNSAEDQMYQIVQALGPPPAFMLRFGENVLKYFYVVTENGKEYYYLHGPCPRRIPLKNILNKEPEEDRDEKLLVAMISNMLDYDGRKRMKASMLKKHVMFRDFNQRSNSVVRR